MALWLVWSQPLSWFGFLITWGGENSLPSTHPKTPKQLYQIIKHLWVLWNPPTSAVTLSLPFPLFFFFPFFLCTFIFLCVWDKILFLSHAIWIFKLLKNFDFFLFISLYFSSLWYAIHWLVLLIIFHIFYPPTLPWLIDNVSFFLTLILFSVLI